jgi:hypothetical protein
MIDLTQGLHTLQTILPAAQSTDGVDFVPLAGPAIQRIVLTLLSAVMVGVLKFFWRKVRRKRRLVCRLVSSRGFGLIDGRPVGVRLEGRQDKVYEVRNSPGVMMLELHTLRGDEILSDHIKGREFTISFSPAEVMVVYERPEDGLVTTTASGGTLTLRPQCLTKDSPVSLQVVLEGYDENITPEINGEVVGGGKIKLIRLDRPAAADGLARAFTFVVIGVCGMFLFFLLLAAQLSQPRSLLWLFITSAFMAGIITLVPYVIFYGWLKERGAPGSDFPPLSFWGRVSKHIPSIRFISNKSFFWKLFLIAFVLFLLPGLAEMWVIPPLTNLSSYLRKLIGF